MPALIFLLVVTVTLAVAAPPPAARGSIVTQRCHADPNVHCIYASQSVVEYPKVRMSSGSVIATEVDNIGSSTFVLEQNSVGSITVRCAEGGGQNVFYFLFQNKFSQIDHRPESTGRATIAFNDDGGLHPKPGSSAFSHMAGVDATISCPFAKGVEHEGLADAKLG